MKNYLLLLLVLSFFLCGVNSASANDNELIQYLNPRLIIPQNSQDSLKIRFVADELKCKKAYGSNWENVCHGYIGEYGERVYADLLSPNLKGSWAWSGGDELQFILDTKVQWTPDTKINLDLTQLPLPRNILLSTEKLTFTTLPQAFGIFDDNLWIDPSQRAKHMFSFTINFLYPLESTDDFIKNVSIKPKDKNSAMQLGKEAWIWNTQKNQVAVNVPILQLPTTTSPLSIEIKNLPSYIYEESGLKIIPTQTSEATFGVTGKDDVFSINNIELIQDYGDALNQEYHLAIETTLHVTSEELQKALKLVTLPRTNTAEARIPYSWNEAPSISPDDIKGTPLKIVNLIQGNDPKTKHLFSVQAEPQTYIYTTLSQSLASVSGETMSKPFVTILYANKFEPNITFMQSGNLLNLQGSQTLSIRAHQLTEIKWEAQLVRVPYLALLSQGFYDFSDSKIDFDPISELYTSVIPLADNLQAAKEKQGAQFVTLDLKPFLHKADADTRGIMRITLKGMQGDEEMTASSRLILVTDLGLLVKQEADGARVVFVSSLATGKPLSGVNVEILGANGLPLVSALTDKSGKALLPSVNGFAREKEPVAIVASKKNGASEDITFLSLSDYSGVVNLRQYPTQGRNTSVEGMSAYVFSERGIFRPGETLQFASLIRSATSDILQNEVPLRAVLYDPTGTIVLEKAFTVNEKNYGLVDFAWQSKENSPTGRYRLDIQIAQKDKTSYAPVVGSGVVRVEEFQPDTMSISTQIEPKTDKGWIVYSPNEKISATVLLKNLYGLPAAQRKVTSEITLNATTLRFDGYKDYVFYDPSSYSRQYRHVVLPEATTDDEGKTVLPLDFTEALKGTLSCSLYVEGFEPNGGRAVTDMKDFLVSPMEKIVGYKITGEATNINYIPEGSQGQFEFVTVDSHLDLIPSEDITFILSDRRYVTNLVSDSSDNYRYEETPIETEISRLEYKADGNNKVTWKIPTDKAGDYLLTLVSSNNKDASPLALVPFTVAGTRVKADPTTVSSVLRLRTDKTNYASGDTINVSLSLPYDGSGLITLEREKVLTHTWFNAKAGESEQKISIPNGIEGRVYVQVSYMRSLESKDIYMVPHSFALAPITVNVDKRDLGLSLEAPEIVLPDSEVQVTIKAKEAGKAYVFAVDEGVLSLTKFVTPSPVNYLLQDRALEVMTRQIFDRLMPEAKELNSRMAMASAPYGGDMAKEGGRFYNPFKRRAEPPLAFWSALVDVNPQGTTVSVPIPNYYNGNVRIMTVGASEMSFGSAEKSMLVRNKIVLTPQIPVMATPTDVFEGALAIANTEANTDININLSVETSEGLTLLTDIPTSFVLKQGEEKLVSFKVKTEDILGEAKMTFIVKDDTGLTVKRESTLSVRPPNPYSTTLIMGSIEPNSKQTLIDVNRTLYDFDAEASFTLSPLPIAFVRALTTYLDNYEYNSTEQLISRAMPHVVLSKNPQLLYGDKKDSGKAQEKGRALINEAIQAISASYQHGGNGGVARWVNSEPDALLTVYSGDFFLSMREVGMFPPVDIENQIFTTIDNISMRTPSTLEQARVQAYAIWVLTREGRITTQSIESLLDVLEKAPETSGLSAWRTDVTSAFLAGAYNILRLQDEANKLIDYTMTEKGLTKTTEFKAPMDIFAATALQINVLVQSFPERLNSDTVSALINNTLAGYRKGYSTFSAALGVKALASLSNTMQDSFNFDNVVVKCTNASDFEILSTDMNMLSASAPLCSQISVSLKEPAKTPLYYQVASSGYDKKLPSQIVSEGMEVTRVFTNAQGEVVTSAKLGEELNVFISAHSFGKPLSDVVIIDMLAGGFEMVLGNANEAVPLAFPSFVRREQREDRMILFVDLTPENTNITYKVRAVNKGEFNLPAIYGSAMYNNAIYSHSVGSIIEIE